MIQKLKHKQATALANPRFRKARAQRTELKTELREARTILLHPALFNREQEVAA